MKNFINWGRNAFFEGARKYISLALLAVISLVVLTVYSCEKENLRPEGTTERTEMTNLERITAFKQMLASVEAGEIEMRTTYTEEELIWEIEADINYTYGNPHMQYDTFDVASDTIDVPELSGGTVSAREMAEVYEEVLAFVECHYEGVGFSGKKLKVVDVYEISGEDAIGVTSVVGQLNSTGFWLTAKSFQSGDNWDGFSSNCAETAPVTKSAATEVGRLTNWNLGNHMTSLDYYLTDIEVIHIFPSGYPGYNNYNPNDPTEDDWVVDYMIWWLDYCIPNTPDPCSGVELESGSQAYEDAKCIEYDEMNFYLGNVADYIGAIEQQEGKDFIDTYMKSEASLSNEYFMSWYEETLFGTVNTSGPGLTYDLDDCP